MEDKVKSEMNESDVFSKLNNELVDEYEGVCSYIEISKMIGDSGYAQILRDIAWEEWVHAKHLTEILSDANKLKSTEEIMQLKNKAEEHMKSVYQ